MLCLDFEPPSPSLRIWHFWTHPINTDVFYGCPPLFKAWDVHHQWTSRCIEEFFVQGDREAEMGLEFSPLCDRNNTMVPQSQIGA